jgi:aminomethyltransferase
MDVETLPIGGAECWVSRSGYTGEDGFEISVPKAAVVDLANSLLAHDDVEFIGLGARDSLRLEAGLCLYGHDIDQQTSPIEAGLTWAIQSRRRTGGGFPGAERMQEEIASGPAKRRVGILPEGRAPVREGCAIFASETATDPVGTITSGGFGPTVSAPVSMGYVQTAYSANDTVLFAEVRGKRLPVKVAKLPFTGPNFKR